MNIIEAKRQKGLKYMALKMALEAPNETLNAIYQSGMPEDEIKDLKYIINAARRAPGYDPEKDLILKMNIA
ncbi:hypothetical protein [Acidithiobacillus thiooxidans]|uniref:Uncharacterized protein n=2 Tax=Acidithiobacillus thiooxidans TaxID=930 RepID=A0A543Q278_ACITH|nr:hypothetical protein [Acidithiobacillus thiooxidans]MDX5935440.1 hypothetical protein [Acidithiobacillus thiooxidans]OCX67484.1 hypothetical protein A6O24_20830 [Acidithiobacillus thiooxidans]OCX76927.1 hypothetical protein A6P07_01305 [Acidithiobacillus thiooxidans]OCX85601.1 hypothetical protein A6O26_00815 [Acidithiobacillus thiooxidans]OCX86247.1 hypothetical protein A6M27_13195 [Acidithiobacillus thiooxidans]